MRTIPWRRLAVAAVLLAIAVAATTLPLDRLLLAVLARIERLGPWAAPAIGALYIPACVFFLPGSLITLGAGFLLGLWPALVAVSLGSTAGATVAFLLGRSLARERVARWLEAHPRLRAIELAVAEQGWRVVLLTRLSPAFPFNLLNYAFGLTGVSLREYVLASWIGMLPGTFLYVYLGTSARDLTELVRGPATAPRGPRLALLLAGLLATVIVTVLITRRARAALAAVLPPSEPE